MNEVPANQNDFAIPATTLNNVNLLKGMALQVNSVRLLGATLNETDPVRARLLVLGRDGKHHLQLLIQKLRENVIEEARLAHRAIAPAYALALRGATRRDYVGAQRIQRTVTGTSYLMSAIDPELGARTHQARNFLDREMERRENISEKLIPIYVFLSLPSEFPNNERERVVVEVDYERDYNQYYGPNVLNYDSQFIANGEHLTPKALWVYLEGRLEKLRRFVREYYFAITGEMRRVEPAMGLPEYRARVFALLRDPKTQVLPVHDILRVEGGPLTAEQEIERLTRIVERN